MAGSFSVWSVLKLAGRAAIWRTTPDPRGCGLGGLILLLLLLAALRAAIQLVAAGPHPELDPYGANALVAWIALEVAVAMLLVPAAGRATALAAMVVLLIFAELVVEAAMIGWSLRLPAVFAVRGPWGIPVLSVATIAVASLWWIGAMVAVVRSVAPQPRLPALRRVGALWAALVAVTVIVPHVPIFIGRHYDPRTANLWEYLAARSKPSSDQAAIQPEAVAFERSQHALLKAEVARLEPPRQGAVSIYAIGIAGWADQDVFLKELDGGLAAIGGILPIRGRTLRLVNHRETSESEPLATQRNFAAAVHAVAALMDKKNDVLLLLMTSHGTQSGFALRLPNEVTTELTPQEVAATLDKEGITNRIVIVSACYAGTFVAPLANANTIVLTAADAKSTSFGCAPERDWTYFGDAFFRQSLHRGSDLQQAFANARILISGWELMDRAPPSNPQGSFGPALVARLAPFFAPATSAGQ